MLGSLGHQALSGATRLEENVTTYQRMTAGVLFLSAVAGAFVGILTHL